MPNTNYNSNIELGPRSNRPNPPPSDPRNYYYRIFSINKDKAIKIAATLILLLLILDFWPLFALMPYVPVNKSFSYTTEIRGALDFMSLNLKTDPTLDLKIVAKGTTCPAGFEPLKLGVWPGTEAGCLYEDGRFGSSCSDTGSVKPQKEIPSTFPIDLEEWNGSLWCGKKAVLGTDYIKKAECPSGYKECYSGGCFLGDCPITKVEMTASRGDLTLTKTEGEPPLINIQISPNDIPCFNQNRDAYSAIISSYYFLARRAYGCDKYGLDSQFSSKLDSKPIFESSTQYSFKYSTANLPNFEDYSKKSMAVISARTRMRTAKHDHCLNLDEKLIRDSAKAFDKSAPLLTVTVYAIMIRIVLLPFAAIMRCCMSKRDFWGGLAYTSNKLLLLLVGLNSLLLFVISRITYSYGVLREARGYFERYASLGCFGEGQGSAVVNDYLKILRQGEINCWMYFWLIGSFSLYVLISLWYLRIKKISSERRS